MNSRSASAAPVSSPSSSPAVASPTAAPSVACPLLGQSEDPSVVGGKAANLARALRAGFLVPPGFVVPAGAQVAEADVLTAVAKLGEHRFAVRSSAVNEDGRAHSFAGQLETKLNVSPAEVLAAVQTCVQSAESLRALRYSDAAEKVAVLVQVMVPAQAAGVAFSAHPSTGERDVVQVEAVRGLGEALVSGETTPEAWSLRSGTLSRDAGQEPVLSEDQARKVAELARKMEDLFGAPQDVEWAFRDGELHLLQSRPITALPAAPVPLEVEVPEGDWERDDHHGVLSPLGWKWFEPYAPALAKSMASVGVPVREIRTRSIGGHVYLQMVMIGGDRPPPPSWVMWLFTRLVPSLRRANKHCCYLLDEDGFAEAFVRWENEVLPQTRARTNELFLADPSALSDEELLARIEACFEHSAAGLAEHAQLHGPCLIGVGKLALFLEDVLGWDPDRALEMVAGTSEKTTELSRSVEAIVADHDDELDEEGFPANWARLATRAPGLAKALSSWLEENRLRILHYDPKHPTLGEQPDLVLSIVEAIHWSRRHPPEKSSEPAAWETEARGKLSAEDFEELQRLLVLARRGYALRDENGVELVSRPAGLLRHYVVELGRRAGLAVPEHAVYLHPEEYREALQGTLPDLSDRIERRRGEESWALRHRGPLRHGKPPPPMPPLDAFPSGLRAMMRIFAWMMRIDTMSEEPQKEGEALKGLGLGTTAVTARARVIDHPAELPSLKHGEVLVCRITSPEWSVALGRVAALVSDEGGALSHPAIIAREYKVPAVVGTHLATQTIQTGDLVHVDAVAGTVRVVKS